jgi:DNA-binding NtrC family response regulator
MAGERGPNAAKRTGGGEPLPPARLIRLHRHSLTNVLVTGGTAALRDQVARAFHRESPLRNGAFVPLDCSQDEDRLRASLLAWTAAEHESDPNPLQAAEEGTLYLDLVERLSLDSQRLLLALARRLHGEPVGGTEGPCAGRLVVGNPRALAEAVAEGGLLPALLDAVDKVRVELDPSGPEASA